MHICIFMYICIFIYVYVYYVYMYIYVYMLKNDLITYILVIFYVLK